MTLRSRYWKITDARGRVQEVKGAGGGSKAKANDANAGAWQLYDMETDPGEVTDIAKENPETVARSAFQVGALVGPYFLIEIEAIAAKKPGK